MISIVTVVSPHIPLRQSFEVNLPEGTQLYYYILTFDGEVAKIWPQSRWRLGKILYLTTRYSFAIWICIEISGKPPSLMLKGQGTRFKHFPLAAWPINDVYSMSVRHHAFRCIYCANGRHAELQKSPHFQELSTLFSDIFTPVLIGMFRCSNASRSISRGRVYS